MTATTPTADAVERRRPGLLELGLVVVVAALWIPTVIGIASGPVDLGFTTTNAAWQALLAWVLPTLVLILAAAASRTRLLAIVAAVAAGIELVGLAIVLVVQVVFGARAEFLVETTVSLAFVVAACVAAVLALRATRMRASRGLVVAAVLVGVAVILVRRTITLVQTLVAFADLGDPLLLLTLAVGFVPSALLTLGVALAAIRLPIMRWIAGAVMVVAALVGVALALSNLTLGQGISPGPGLLVGWGLTIAGGVLVGCSAITLSRERQARRAAPRPQQSPAWAQQPQVGAGPAPPPPAPGTQVPPPGGTRPQ